MSMHSPYYRRKMRGMARAGMPGVGGMANMVQQRRALGRPGRPPVPRSHAAAAYRMLGLRMLGR